MGVKAELESRRRVDPVTGCWIWTGNSTDNGHGQVRGRIFIDGKYVHVHRVAYQVYKGEPKNLVCHRCDNSLCINPDHLYDGTYGMNNRDALDRKRRIPFGVKGPRGPQTGMSRSVAYWRRKMMKEEGDGTD